MNPVHWTLGDWWLLAMAVYAATLGTAYLLLRRHWYNTGWEDGRDCQISLDLNARLRDIRDDLTGTRARTGPPPAPRHAATEPRTGGAGQHAASPARIQKRPRVVTTATTADSIAPVIYPEAWTAVPLRPQPASDPGRHTAAMSKLSDTGELRALTDEYIHNMRWSEEQHRRGIRARNADARPDQAGPAPAGAQGAGPLPPEGR